MVLIEENYLGGKLDQFLNSPSLFYLVKAHSSREVSNRAEALERYTLN